MRFEIECGQKVKQKLVRLSFSMQLMLLGLRLAQLEMSEKLPQVACGSQAFIATVLFGFDVGSSYH